MTAVAAATTRQDTALWYRRQPKGMATRRIREVDRMEPHQTGDGHQDNTCPGVLARYVGWSTAVRGDVLGNNWWGSRTGKAAVGRTNNGADRGDYSHR